MHKTKATGMHGLTLLNSIVTCCAPSQKKIFEMTYFGAYSMVLTVNNEFQTATGHL